MREGDLESFVFLTCPRKERFKPVTSTSLGIIPAD